MRSPHVVPALLGGVALGILAADRGIAVPATALIAASVLAGLLATVLPARPLLLAGVVGAGIVLGAGRLEATTPDPDGSVADLVDSHEHTLVGMVVDDPRPRAARLQIVLGDLRTDGGRELQDRLLVWVPRGPDVGAGDRLTLTAELELPQDFDGFAYREYLARQGIGAIARPRSVTVGAPGAGVIGVMGTLRGVLHGGLLGLVPEPEAALGAGILLGIRSAIAPEIAEDFATAGLTHVVAISGWNIAIVVALVAAGLRPLERRRGGRRAATLAAAGTVGAYVLLTGASPSVVRAALMAGAMLVGRLAGSRSHAMAALGLAALIMTLAAPSVLWDVGFQLSLLATAGLIWYGGAFEGKLGRWPAWIREPVALTLAAQVTTLPVILLNFERLSLVAPIANVLVVPIVPLAMAGSAVAAVTGTLLGAVPLGTLGDGLGWIAGGTAWLVLRAMVVIGEMTASVPLAAIDVSVPAPFAIAWFPLLGLATWALRHDGAPAGARVPDEAMTGAVVALTRLLRPIPVAVAWVGLLAAITFVEQPDGRLHVTVLDIGQGDAILVESPTGARMLVDGGPDAELTLRRLGATLPFHARDVDLVVLSHPHQDHVGGLVDVVDRFDVGAVLHAGIGFESPAYDRLLTDAAGAGIPVVLARAGQRLHLDPSTTVEFLYPTAADAGAPLPDGDINNGSIVLLVRHGAFSAILTGDAESPVEQALVARDVLPDVDVLKVGHHGSHSSTTTAFVEALRPELAVISAGVDNEYGHPAPETLATLATHGVAPFRTDLHGDLEIVSDGRTYRIRTEHGGWGPERPAMEIPPP